MTVSVAQTVSFVPQLWGNNVVGFQWAGLGNTSGTNTGQSLGGPGFTDYSIQLEGTAGAGFTLVIEGSNDQTNFRTLNDPFGNALSFTSTGVIKQVTEIALLVRPRVTAGDNTTNVTVTMVRGSHSPN